MILYHDNECETRASHYYSFIRSRCFYGDFLFNGVITSRHSSIREESYLYGLLEVLWGKHFMDDVGGPEIYFDNSDTV